MGQERITTLQVYSTGRPLCLCVVLLRRNRKVTCENAEKSRLREMVAYDPPKLLAYICGFTVSRRMVLGEFCSVLRNCELNYFAIWPYSVSRYCLFYFRNVNFRKLHNPERHYEVTVSGRNVLLGRPFTVVTGGLIKCS